MAYVDVNVPVISKITLPSGNEYYIADREIRDVVDAISQAIAGGVSFVIAWDGSSAPTVANIPKGVKVVYSGTTYTGTLEASSATPGAFYLVKSGSDTSEVPLDVYDEYVPVDKAGQAGVKTWEKIGDTQIDLKDVITGVTFNKDTISVVTGYSSPTSDVALGEATTFALTSGAWVNDSYRTITFTSDAVDTEYATKSEFISWLQANATQILPPVIDRIVLPDGTEALLADTVSGYIKDLVAGNNITVSTDSEGNTVISSSGGGTSMSVTDHTLYFSNSGS